MCKVSCFEEILSGFVDRALSCFSERNRAGNRVSNSRAHVVVYAEKTTRGKSHFGRAHFELAVNLSHVAVDDLVKFDFRCYAPNFQVFLGRFAIGCARSP